MVPRRVLEKGARLRGRGEASGPCIHAYRHATGAPLTGGPFQAEERRVYPMSVLSRHFAFTDAELDQVEDDLVQVFEDCTWNSEERYFRPSFLRRGLRQRGHSWARIEATLSRLIDRGVLELRNHESKYIIDFELTKYWTTPDRWFAYVAQRRRRYEAAFVSTETANPSDNKRTKLKQARRGRPVDTDPQADQRIDDAWKSGRYNDYEELARALDLQRRQVELAIDRHRKRIEKKKRLAPDQK